jgi:hypothetical protein
MMTLKSGNVCEIWEARKGLMIPPGAVACHTNSGRRYRAGETLVRSDQHGSLLVSRESFEAEFPDLLLAIRIPESPARGYFVWCSLRLSVADPMSLHGRFGGEATPLDDITQKIKPVLAARLKALARGADLTDEPGQRHVEKRLVETLELPSGLSIQRCAIRDVSTVEDREEELRCWGNAWVVIRKIERDMVVAADSIRSFEQKHRIKLLTAEEKNQSPSDRLVTYRRLLSAIQQTRALSADFYMKKLKERRRTANRVREIAPHLALEDVLDLCRSQNRGERVAGFIALSAHLHAGVPRSRRREIRTVMQTGLEDRESRVRYRAVQAVDADPLMRKALGDILNSISNEDPNEAVRDLASDIMAHSDALEEVRSTSTVFYSKSLAIRRKTAERVKNIARHLDSEDVLELCRSEDRGERVAGFIALSAHLQVGVPRSRTRGIEKVLQMGVEDKESRVRYRAVEAIGSDNDMAQHFMAVLERLATKDRNASVRELALQIHRVQEGEREW